jgi:hypothetical protein
MQKNKIARLGIILSPEKIFIKRLEKNFAL